MSINLIKTINYSDPKCLYCAADCSTNHGKLAMAIYTAYDCTSCGEYFSTYLVGDAFELQFTCKEYCIIYLHGELIFNVDNTMIDADELTEIPIFDIDFSDKEKLYNKLKTYLIFT